MLVVTSVCILVRLVGEFTVRVAAEERSADFGQQLLRDQLQARLQRVADLQVPSHNVTWSLV